VWKEEREGGFFSTRTAIVENSTGNMINSTNDGEERGGKGGSRVSFHRFSDLEGR
jgi:hypothetical protein